MAFVNILAHPIMLRRKRRGIQPLEIQPEGPGRVVAVAFGVVAFCALGIGAIKTVTAIHFPARPYFFRLSGLDAKVNTLAEHLAKLLEHEVAGYPPSDPNPNRDPDGGW